MTWTVCDGMQVPGFCKLKQRQSENRCPPETLLLFFSLHLWIEPMWARCVRAIVSAGPHSDIFEPKRNPEPTWLVVEVSQGWSATASHPEPRQCPVLCLQFLCLVLIQFWSASLGLSKSCPFKLALISARDVCFSGHQIHTFTCTLRARGLWVLHPPPFSSCTACTLLDPLLPLLKTYFGNGRGGKGASCGSSKKRHDLDVYMKDFTEE